MSGRIRTLKPEWLEDEDMLRAGSDARVLSVALLLLADDYGRGRLVEPVMAAQVFPFEPDPSRVFRESLARLSGMGPEGGFVRTYVVRGQRYFEVRSWAKHQKVDKPGKPRVPSPSEGEYEDSRDPRETFARLSSLTTTTITTNDQEGRGSGRGCAAAPSPAAPPPPALELVADEPKPAAKPKRAASPESAERAALRAATSALAASFGHDVAPTASRVHLAAGAAKVSGLVSRGVGLREAAERVSRAAYERLQGGRSTSYGYALQDCVLGPSAGSQGPYRGGSSRCATAEELGPPTRLEDIYVLGPEDLELIGAMQ